MRGHVSNSFRRMLKLSRPPFFCICSSADALSVSLLGASVPSQAASDAMLRSMQQGIGRYRPQEQEPGSREVGKSGSREVDVLLGCLVRSLAEIHKLEMEAYSTPRSCQQNRIFLQAETSMAQIVQSEARSSACHDCGTWDSPCFELRARAGRSD